MTIENFIIERITMYTLLLDKGLEFGSFNERLQALPGLIGDFLSNREHGFVSNNSVDFKAYLEDHVGEIRFNKNFAVRIRPDSVRFFVMGEEVFK